MADMGKVRYALALAGVLALVPAASAQAVAKPRLLSTSTARATVAWSAPKGATSQVRYRRPGQKRWRVRSVGKRHRLTLTNLNAAVSYLVEVRTCRRHHGCSRWSKALKLKVPANPTPSPSPAPTPTPSPGGGGPAIGTGGCSVFPADNPWNRDV